MKPREKPVNSAVNGVVGNPNLLTLVMNVILEQSLIGDSDRLPSL